MAQFPFKEADILALADSVLAGLTGHTAIYPDPPVDSADFQAAIDSYHQAGADLTEARAAKEMATRGKQDALGDLKDKLKKQLRYAENVTGFDDNKLNMLGWAGRREKSSILPGPSPFSLLSPVLLLLKINQMRRRPAAQTGNSKKF